MRIIADLTILHLRHHRDNLLNQRIDISFHSKLSFTIFSHSLATYSRQTKTIESFASLTIISPQEMQIDTPQKLQHSIFSTEILSKNTQHSQIVKSNIKFCLSVKSQMDLTSKQRCGNLPRLCYRQLWRAGLKFVKKLTFKLGVDFRLEMCYPYIVRKEIEQ